MKNAYVTAEGSLSQFQSLSSRGTYRNYVNAFDSNTAGAVEKMLLCKRTLGNDAVQLRIAADTDRFGVRFVDAGQTQTPILRRDDGEQRERGGAEDQGPACCPPVRAILQQRFN